ncbi:hypothetical protein [Rubrivirga sp. IMCC45206]|uniref:hypothetical protein n=1 Tax=Rubrivirga sp. IMCC45206 TaxID=3391614 RepID=UPI00399007F1
MRLLLPLVLVALVSLAPARAQVSFVPLIGYDIDQKAATLGLAFEFAAPLVALPLQPAVRPSVEFVFFDSDATYVRGDGDLIARFDTGGPLMPYAKGGVTIEYFDSGAFDNTEVGLNLGGGVEVNRVFVEGAVGFGDISDLRVRAGFRF